MSEFNLEYKDRVKYTLYNSIWQSLDIPEPKGWNDDRLIFKKNDNSAGIINEFSNNLQFYGEGKVYLKQVYDSIGVTANVSLTKKILVHDTSKGAPINSMIWETSYVGYLDFNQYIQEQYFTKIKFNSSPLIRKIRAKESEAIEIERVIDLYNKPISPIEINTAYIKGKNLLFITKYKLNTSMVALTVGQTHGANMAAIVVPFEIYSAGGDVTTSPYDSRLTIVADNYSTGKIGNMVYLISLTDQTISVDIDLNCALFCTKAGNVWLELIKYTGGTSLIYSTKQELVHLTYSPSTTLTIDYKNNLSVNLLKGESIAIALRTQSSADVQWFFGFPTIPGNGGHRTSLIITENSVAEGSQSKFIFAYDMFKTLFEVVGGAGTIFESNYFGRKELGYAIDGPGAHIGVTSGRWIRGFSKNLSDANDKYKPITISLKDALSSAKAILNVDYGVKTLNNKEVVFIEDLKFFYQPTIGIKLPNVVKKVIRSVYSRANYSSLVFGYKKPDDAVSLYEEAFGLDEPNTKSGYSTPLDKVENIYKQVSIIRADNTGMELARRKPQLAYPDTDTRFDNDNWWLNLKVSGAIYELKIWSDNFDTLPIGIYSPETTSNIEFSPANMRKKHEWVFMAGLLKNKEDYIVYTHSMSNSNLKTKLIGGQEISENGDVLISTMDRPRYKADIITFEHFVDDELMKLLKGVTKVYLDEGVIMSIPNFYFKILFTTGNDIWETGYLQSVEPKLAGKWELLLANDNIK